MPSAERHPSLSGGNTLSRRQVSNLSQSVHDRLLDKAKESGRPFNELLQYYAIERFLYRLSRSAYREHFVLKGGLMLVVWEAPVTRPTKDIDLLGRVAPGKLAAILAELCSVPVEDDGLVFDAASVETQAITGQVEGGGVRLRFDGRLGTARVRMQIDVGMGDVVTPEESDIVYPTLLDFPAPRLRAYPRETVVAEKLEAMVRLGEINSRMQDFFDLWLLQGQFCFEGETLVEAVRRTFGKRGTDVTSEPAFVTERFRTDRRRQSQWDAFIRRGHLTGAPDEFRPVVEAVSLFVRPLLEAVCDGRSHAEEWEPGGPWR